MLSSIGRAAIRRGGAGARYASTNRAAQSILGLQRVNITKDAFASTSKSPLFLALLRSYATATKTVVKTKKTTTVKPKAKTTTKKPVKKKAVKKPAAKKKKVAKPKAKKAKKPVKKALTPEQAAKVQLKVLKEKALSPPTHQGPTTAWTVLQSQEYKYTSGQPQNSLASSSKEASAKYKALSPAEKEALNVKANSNKHDHEVAIKKWVETHTPDEIRLANNARAQLKRKYNNPKTWALIPDTRIPKRPTSAYFYFLADRRPSSDFNGIKSTDAAKLIAAEWTSLPTGQRKVFEDRAAADKRRYIQEYKTVFHRDSRSVV